MARFECEGVYNSLVNYLGEDTAVYLSNGELFGYIYSGKDGGDGVKVLEKMTEETEDVLPDIDVHETVETIESETQAKEEVEESEFLYGIVKLGGAVRLNHESVKVEDGGYYTVGEVNFAVGSVIEVHTDKAVFTIRIVGIDRLD